MLLAAAPPGTIPRGQEVAIDTSAAIFTFALSAFVGIGAGLFPAFWPSRRSMRTWLSDGSPAPGRRTKGARALPVVVQVGLAVALLNLAGLLVRRFVEIRSSDLGFVADQTLVHAVDLPRHAYREPERMLALHRQVLQGLAEIPGVVAAGAANLEPFGPLNVDTRLRADDRAPTVTAMVLRQTLMLVLPGLVIGSLASLMATRAIEGSIYGVAATDPVTYAAVALLLGAAAMAAILVPLRRASGIYAADVLRA